MIKENTNNGQVNQNVQKRGIIFRRMLILRPNIYSCMKYRCLYDTQGILGNITITVIPYSYMLYLCLLENFCEMPIADLIKWFT